MRWYWVKFHYSNDGYYTNDTWELVAAESGSHILENWSGANSSAQAIDVVPLELRPIPPTPRRTKHPRKFNPELKQP